MIPDHDLRTVNYVIAGKTLQRVTMINRQSALVAVNLIHSDQASTEQALESILPVMLADKILEQCGFVYHHYFKFWQLLSTGEEIRSELDIDPDYNIIDFVRKPLVKNVAPLHQLQNIYYMLKGKELPITTCG